MASRAGCFLKSKSLTYPQIRAHVQPHSCWALSRCCLYLAWFFLARIPLSLCCFMLAAPWRRRNRYQRLLFHSAAAAPCHACKSAACFLLIKEKHAREGGSEQLFLIPACLVCARPSLVSRRSSSTDTEFELIASWAVVEIESIDPRPHCRLLRGRREDYQC